MEDVVTFVIPGAMLALTVAAPLFVADRLPDPAAVHWGLAGSPDGSLPRAAAVALPAVLFLVVWVGALVGRGSEMRDGALATVYFVGGLVTAVQMMVVAKNLDMPEWTDAQPVAVWEVAVVLGVAVVSGAFGWWVGRRLWPSEAGPPRLAEVADGRHGPDDTWEGRAVNRAMAAAAAVLVALVVVVPGWTRVVFVLAAVAVVTFAAVTVSVGGGEVLVRVGPWGLPVRRIRLDDVERAGVLDVVPLAYGGWGWRARPGVVAVVVRSGRALGVELVGARSFVVTVDEAEQGASLIDHLVEGRREES